MKRVNVTKGHFEVNRRNWKVRRGAVLLAESKIPAESVLNSTRIFSKTNLYSSASKKYQE